MMMSKAMASKQIPVMSGLPESMFAPHWLNVSLLKLNSQHDKTEKLKGLQDLNGDLEQIITHEHYPLFLEHALNIFIEVLCDGTPHFISDDCDQQIRKLILEILHRLPTDEHLKRHIDKVLNCMFKLLQLDNEENVLVCTRIIINLHIAFQPKFSSNVEDFFKFGKCIYSQLPRRLHDIFEPRHVSEVWDMEAVERVLNVIFTITPVKMGCSDVQFNLIPRATFSARVLDELPVIIALMHEQYQELVHDHIQEFIPLFLKTITLEPPEQYRHHPEFNQELFVDFATAQITTLTILVHMFQKDQGIFSENQDAFVEGMLCLFRLCPKDVASLREELLIAARYILATDLRKSFIKSLDQLFDENILIGSGWTAHETLRPSAYSTLADFVYNMRNYLSLDDLCKAVTLFSKIAHDETLPTTTQTMACKLLLNLVEHISASSKEDQEILMRMLEVFVVKLKTVTKLHLPVLLTENWDEDTNIEARPESELNFGFGSLSKVQVKSESGNDVKPAASSISSISGSREDKSLIRRGASSSQGTNYTTADCCNLVKALVCGVKDITSAIWQVENSQDDIPVHRPFLPNEVIIYIRLVKYSFKAVDVYSASNQLYSRPNQVQAGRSKEEEKEILRHLASVFTSLPPMLFKEVISRKIEYIVERLSENSAIQIIANAFLEHSTTLPIFAKILMEYLLKEMEEMGSNADRSNLYLELFKILFESVSLFRKENGHFLKFFQPYLHQIVNHAMALSLTAKEPFNYFRLLIALFDSIDECLVLLPNLLLELNHLQSGLHKQNMKDIFVELCLAVPVSLSSLLPYFSMLMDPLVSALNGSQTLVAQGLNILAACTVSFQSDFVYDSLQPVWAELMQALWRNLRNEDEKIAHTAFKLLGKFGGVNRAKMFVPQKLCFKDGEDNLTIGICFTVDEPSKCEKMISLPVGKIIDAAVETLKSNNMDSFYLEHSWQVIQGFLSGTIPKYQNEGNVAWKLYNDLREAQDSSFTPPLYKSPDIELRCILEKALRGMFVAASLSHLKTDVVPYMVGLVTHYTIVIVALQSCTSSKSENQRASEGMDPLVLIDAIATIMGEGDSELYSPGKFALMLILNTAQLYVGSNEKAFQLPFYDYLIEKMCSLCYNRAWYAKYGGCVAIEFLIDHMREQQAFSHVLTFLRALFFVLIDLTGEVSSGAVDFAKQNLDQLLKEYQMFEGNTCDNVVDELIKLLPSSNACAHQQVKHSFSILANVSGKSISDFMKPYEKTLCNVVLPQEYHLFQNSFDSQLAVLDSIVFCIENSLKSWGSSRLKKLLDDLKTLCQEDDTVLKKQHPCYNLVTNLVPLRKTALHILALCYHIDKDDIFHLLCMALKSDHKEIQKCSFEFMKELIPSDCLAKHEVDCQKLLSESDMLKQFNFLSYLVQLFPLKVPDKQFVELQHNFWFVVESSSDFTFVENIEQFSCISTILQTISNDSSHLACSLLHILFCVDKNLMLEAAQPFRDSIIAFFSRYKQMTLMTIITTYFSNEQASQFVELLLKGDEGLSFRSILHEKSCLLVTMIESDDESKCYMALRLLRVLIKYETHWLPTQHMLLSCLKKMWLLKIGELHSELHFSSLTYWKNVKILAKCLLSYFKECTSDIELLFDLHRAFTAQFALDFQFLQSFVENTIANTYSVEWKRNAFFKFASVFNRDDIPQDLKSKILQLLIIPSFAVSFKEEEGDLLVCGAAKPMRGPDEKTVINVFISDMIAPKISVITSNAVRIMLLRLACLLVQQAHKHIYAPSSNMSKHQEEDLRKLMTFAWPCLLTKKCVDPIMKYHGHLLLANIIAKFSIHKGIVRKVFHSLLKAHVAEARTVVQQALDVLMPEIPNRVKDKDKDSENTLIQCTKKVIQEGHSVSQLVHLLQLLVRHIEIYKPVLHELIPHMMSSLKRLASMPNITMEHKKLAVDVAEVIIQHECEEQRKKNEEKRKDSNVQETGEGSFRENIPGVLHEFMAQCSETAFKSGKTANFDALVEFLLDMARRVNDSPSGASSSYSEELSQRCVSLLKTVLTPDLLKPSWFVKLHSILEDDGNTVNSGNHPNYSSMCIALDIMHLFLLTLKDRRNEILSVFPKLHTGIMKCIRSQNSEVVQSIQTLLLYLMEMFPIDPRNVYSDDTYKELHELYRDINLFILSGLHLSGSLTSSSSCALYGTLIVLKAACNSNPLYIDHIMETFITSLHNLQKNHIDPQTDDINITNSDLLILGLNLIKCRLADMKQGLRALFLKTVLVDLIEKSPDVEVLKEIVKMISEWIMHEPLTKSYLSLIENEISVVMIKMMHLIEERFPDNLGLQTDFLHAVHHVYSTPKFSSTDLKVKLEFAFMAGLRCNEPHTRSMFSHILNSSLEACIYNRLTHIVCSQNWKLIGEHYWIKQCIEILLMATSSDTYLWCQPSDICLPSLTSFTHMTDFKSEDYKMEEEDSEGTEDCPENGDGWSNDHKKYKHQNVNLLIQKQIAFLNSCQNQKTIYFLTSTAQICHVNISLTECLWIQVFPRVWQILNNDQQQELATDIILFLRNQEYILQKDCRPNPAATIAEGFLRCAPLMQLKPADLNFMGESYNLWHRACLLLERLSYEENNSESIQIDDSYSLREAEDALLDMYDQLKEEDLWSGIWHKKAKYPETSEGIAFEQQGCFTQAQSIYKTAMINHHEETTRSPSLSAKRESAVWVEHWTRCTKELCNWESLLKYGTSHEHFDPYLVLENAWKKPDWKLMEVAMQQVKESCPKELEWKVNLYKGFLNIWHSEKRDLAKAKNQVKLVSDLCIRDWRKLPNVISNVHLPILQAAQQMSELEDAVDIHQYLKDQESCYESSLCIKGIVKKWCDQLPALCDDLSHCAEIFAWRQMHYNGISSSYVANSTHLEDAKSYAQLAVQAFAQSNVCFSKMARKQGLLDISLKALERLNLDDYAHILPEEYFKNIRQQVKCYLQCASLSDEDSIQEEYLNQGLQLINSAKFDALSSTMTAELLAMKGQVFDRLGHSHEANVAFVSAVSVHSSVFKTWALWGDYYANLFTKVERNMQIGVLALTCYFNSCRQQNASKSAKYLAKVLWLLTYDDENQQLAATFRKYAFLVPSVQWVSWIPQLLTCVTRKGGALFKNLLCHVGHMFPQATFFPIRALQQTLEAEGTSGTALSVCKDVINFQRKFHPAALAALEGILNEMLSFQANMYEEGLQNLHQALAKCYEIAFSKACVLSDVKTEPCLWNLINSVVSSFKKYSDRFCKQGHSISSTFGSLFNSEKEYILYEKMKEQFAADFSDSSGLKLYSLIAKLKKWIKIFQAKTSLLPKSFLLEGRCPFLCHFSEKTAEIGVPGEFLFQRPNYYYVHIVRFLPVIDIVEKHGVAARRLYIQGHNGKIYPYLIIGHSSMDEVKHGERVLQLLRLLNLFLNKQKETLRRFLNFTVPHVLSLSPQVQLVEDNVSSTSLFDIYEQWCSKRDKDPDEPLFYYYQHLAAKRFEEKDPKLLSILDYVQKKIVPQTLLKDWAKASYPSATDYWAFRKQFTSQHSLIILLEYALYLTRLAPDMMYIHRDSGLLNISRLKFNVHQNTGELVASSDPALFRLTPNIAELITSTGICGPVTASIVATAQCLMHPNFVFRSFLMVILKDEIVEWNKRKNPKVMPEDINSTEIIEKVTKAVNAITVRLQSLTKESNVSCLLAAASSAEKLCCMDPAWHPWL